uniref:Uncharacterized protein n=1 Tax=Solanum lycopersicum TaxID=4081 RepID=A0A3Q7FGJ2_SOLLC
MHSEPSELFNISTLLCQADRNRNPSPLGQTPGLAQMDNILILDGCMSFIQKSFVSPLIYVCHLSSVW